MQQNPVEYTAHAIKDLNKLPSEVKTKIFTGIGKIKEDPYEHVKKLKTSAKSPLYSLRVVEYRVIMAIKEPLTEEEIKGIEESLEDIKAGRVYSEKEAKRMLGLED